MNALMSNDTDLFFSACRAGSVTDINAMWSGRCVTEKRQGALICCEHGYWDLADTIFHKLPINQRSTSMEEILANPQRFNRASELFNHLYNSTDKRLCMRSMAVNNHWRSFEFLIKNNHLPDPRKIPSNPAQLSEDTYIAARCGSLEVLDILTPNRTSNCVKSLLRSTLEVNQYTTVPHLCDKLPEELFSLAMQQSRQHHNIDLIRFLIHSMLNRDNTNLLLAGVFNSCLRNDWDEPIHDYAQVLPQTLKDIFTHMQTLGDDQTSKFVPFLSYYEKHLLTQSLSDEPASTRIVRKL